MHGIEEEPRRPSDTDATTVYGSGSPNDRLRRMDLLRTGSQRHEETHRSAGEGATVGFAFDLAGVQVCRSAGAAGRGSISTGV